MKFSIKKTVLVGVALSTFFAAALSYSREKTRWTQRMMTDTPTKSDTSTQVKTDAATGSNKELPCRTGALAVSTHFMVPAKWKDVKSEFKVPYMQSGNTSELDCTLGNPKLQTDANFEATSGKIKVQCLDGILRVTESTCKGRDNAQIEEERKAAEEAARIEAARIAEENRLAAIKAEEERIAREQAAAAAAAAQCPNNCNGAVNTLRGGSGGKGGGNNTWTVTYQACNNGQQVIRSSGNNKYATGACYNSVK